MGDVSGSDVIDYLLGGCVRVLQYRVGGYSGKEGGKQRGWGFTERYAYRSPGYASECRVISNDAFFFPSLSIAIMYI